MELSDKPAFVLFTGLPGSGKSTELLRLQQRLADQHKAHLLVVHVNAETALDLMNPIDISDIMAALVHETERCVLEVEQRDPNEALKDGYLQRLWNWLSNTDIDLKEVEFKVDDATTLVAELRTRPTLRQRVRDTIAIHLSRFLKEARDELTLLEGRATAKGYQGLVLVLDSLEKLRGMSSNYEDVLASAERLFSGGAPHLQLPVHVIYTVPAALVCRRHFPEVAFLPMLCINYPQDAVSKPGREAARAIVSKRVSNEQLERQLGVEFETRIGQLIDWSGGYPRELVRLLQSAFAVSEAPLSKLAFERLLNEVSDSCAKELQSSSPSLNPERVHRVNRPRLSETRSSPSKCRLDPSRQQLIGLSTAEAKQAKVGGAWRTVGRVVVDETRVHHVNLKVAGFVERIYVDFIGKQVQKGQPLFSMYSPELLAAQDEYILALKTRGILNAATASPDSDNDTLVSASRRRLALWDLPEKTLDQFAQTRRSDARSNDSHRQGPHTVRQSKSVRLI